MPTFEYIEDRPPNKLVKDDMIMHDNAFWRVIENYQILGHPANGQRLVIITPHHLRPGSGVKALQLPEHRVPTYMRTD